MIPVSCGEIAVHKSPIKNGLPLTLLVTRVFLVDDEQFALPANDLAISAALLDGCSNFHVSGLILWMMNRLLVAVDDTAPAEVIRTHLHTHLIARENADIVHTHLTGNGRENLVPVLKPDTEHRVRQCLDNNAVLLD